MNKAIVKKAIAWLPRMAVTASLVSLILISTGTSLAQAQVVEQARWMKDAKWGIGYNYLAGGGAANVWYNIEDYDDWEYYVNAFDVNKFADKVEKIGAGYVLFTLGQNRGYISAPSSVYDNNSPPCPGNDTTGTTTVAKGCKNQTGKNKADYTPTRDLVLDLGKAVKAKGLKFIVYTPSHGPSLWTGVKNDEGFRDQWYFDFIEEMTRAWGDNIDGWWFDGCYGPPYGTCPTSVYPKKFYDVTTGINDKYAITFNSGIGIPKSFRSNTGYDHYTPGEMNRLFRQSDFDGVSNGEIARSDGEKIQWHGWTYVTHHDPFNSPDWGGWGQVEANLRFTKEQIRDNTKFVVDRGGIVTWDVGLNPNGAWSLSKLQAMQAAGNGAGSTDDTTYSGLTLVNNDNSGITYSSDGNWSTFRDRKTGDYRQDVAATRVNGAYIEYTFTGASVVWATSKTKDTGNIEIFIDNVSQGTFSTNDTGGFHLVQNIIFEKHDLTDTEHTLKVVKRSGNFMVVDVLGIGPASSGKVNNTDSRLVKTGVWDTSSPSSCINYRRKLVLFCNSSLKHLLRRFLDRTPGEVQIFEKTATS